MDIEDIEELHAAGSVSNQDVSRQSKNVGVKTTRATKDHIKSSRNGEREKTSAMVPGTEKIWVRTFGC